MVLLVASDACLAEMVLLVASDACLAGTYRNSMTPDRSAEWSVESLCWRLCGVVVVVVVVVAAAAAVAGSSSSHSSSATSMSSSSLVCWSLLISMQTGSPKHPNPKAFNPKPQI